MTGRAPRGERRPSPTQIKLIRKKERELGLPRRWVRSRQEATEYRRELRREERRRAHRAERERHPDQWSLPAGSSQLYTLRREGIPFFGPLTRREAEDLKNAHRDRRSSARGAKALGDGGATYVRSGSA